MGIGLLELVVIAVAALVLLGPERLPDVIKQLGRAYVQLRRTSNEFRGVFDNVVRQAEEELRLAEIKRLTDLAGQGSQIAQKATDELHKIGNDIRHTPQLLDQQTPLPPAVVPPPQGREANATSIWDPQEKPAETKA